MKCQISVTDIQSVGYISAARASNTQLFCNFYDSSVYRPSCFYCNHSTSCSYSFYSAPCIYSYNYFYCSSVCASLSCKSDVSVFLSLCKYGCFLVTVYLLHLYLPVAGISESILFHRIPYEV